MSDPTSRYKDSELRFFNTVDENGAPRQIPYLARRVIPQPETLRMVSTVTLGHAERLDLAATRALGSPLLYWRLCDANKVMNPRDLEISGTVLLVPLPSV
jgi:hypothetical protein